MYSEKVRLVEKKPSNRNTSSSKIGVSTQRPNRKVSNYADDRWINPNMGRNQRKKEENTRYQNTSPPKKNQNSSPAREQSWMENDCDEMTELDFRKWIMRNICELKKHALNQCKATKNLE